MIERGNEMDKKEAKKQICNYLKDHGIKYIDHFDGEERCIMMVYQNQKFAPDNVIESCVYFFDTCMEVRVYYNENASSWIAKSECKLELYRLLNFVNARVWPRVEDGLNGDLYQPRHLYSPRFYVTEDGGKDLTCTTIIDYDFYELAPLETEDFITAALPELLNKLSRSIFFVVIGKMSVDEAILRIKKDVLEEE